MIICLVLLSTWCSSIVYIWNIGSKKWKWENVLPSCLVFFCSDHKLVFKVAEKLIDWGMCVTIITVFCWLLNFKYFIHFNMTVTVVGVSTFDLQPCRTRYAASRGRCLSVLSVQGCASGRSYDIKTCAKLNMNLFALAALRTLFLLIVESL